VADGGGEPRKARLKLLLGLLAVSCEPPTLDQLALWMGGCADGCAEVEDLLAALGTLFGKRFDDGKVRGFHKSIYDWLLDPQVGRTRCDPSKRPQPQQLTTVTRHRPRASTTWTCPPLTASWARSSPVPCSRCSAWPRRRAGKTGDERMPVCRPRAGCLRAALHGAMPPELFAAALVSEARGMHPVFLHAF
jgi:hypothetical protein